MFDVFYIGKQPHLFPHERQVSSIEQACEQSRTRFFWVVNYLSDYSGFDFLWEPSPWQAHQRHAWPDQHQPDSGTYLVPKQGFNETNYHTDRYIHRLPDLDCWYIPDYIDPKSIDRRWSPDPMDPPYIYEFPVEWGWDAIGGPEYRVPGATERKYVYHFQARTLPDPANFAISDRIAADDPVMRWRPNPAEPPYIYIFGNQWHAPEVRESARYTVPGAIEKKYVSELRCTRLADPADFDFLYPADFDCSWEPDPGSPPYIYVFGNQYYAAEVMPTVRFAVPGAVDEKFESVPAQLRPDTTGPWILLHDCEWDYTWRPEPGSPPYIYVFGNQWWPAEKMPTVEYHMLGATERKYMPGPVARLPADMTHWHIPAGVDTRDMDFSWVPDPGEPPYIYQFATQHQKTGGPQYRVPRAEEVKYLDMMRAEVSQEAVPIYEIDHMDGNAGQIPNTVKKIRYFDNYRDTLIRLAKNLQGQHEHVWVCSSVCDYSNFDFSWHPETWQATMLHVFASDEQKFGDTFYMHVPTFAERAERKALLEWTSVNYVPRIRVPRRPIPVIYHEHDSHVDAVVAADFTAPLALFTTDQNINRATTTVPLWREEVKTITPISKGATAVIVPKAAVGSVRTQLYDYPHIDKTKVMLTTDRLDVVFIANGEPNAEENWQRLQQATEKVPNRVVRIDNVNGRVAAYQAAASISNTPWFFAVFAKLFVSDQFDWSWQPDRMQQPKHYIFHARNPVNDLVYGHQAMIAYNRRMTLENPAQGLDFTLDQPHEVVPLLSGVANYNHSAWMCWRTAFREVIKLRHSLPDVENEYRLQQWMTVGRGQNGEYSIMGAEDAVEYYDSVNGEFSELRKTYEWAWLASYAFLKRKIIAD